MGVGSASWDGTSAVWRCWWRRLQLPAAPTRHPRDAEQQIRPRGAFPPTSCFLQPWRSAQHQWRNRPPVFGNWAGIWRPRNKSQVGQSGSGPGTGGISVNSQPGRGPRCRMRLLSPQSPRHQVEQVAHVTSPEAALWLRCSRISCFLIFVYLGGDVHPKTTPKLLRSSICMLCRGRRWHRDVAGAVSKVTIPTHHAAGQRLQCPVEGLRVFPPLQVCKALG